MLCEQTITPTLESCRALLACGITGRFETWHEGEGSARMIGDIERAAGLTVEESRKVSPRFAKWRPDPRAHNAERGSDRRSPASEMGEGRGGVAQMAKASPASVGDTRQ